MKADLHCHSYYSDGAHSPEYLLDRAISRGITHLALTDHDCVEGGLVLRNSVKPAGLTLIDGVEISALWGTVEVHIVGLCIDPLNPALNEVLTTQQQRRYSRVSEISKAMEKADILGLEHYIKKLPCCAPGRRHISEFLIKSGKYNKVKTAFRQISRGGRFYVPPQWCSLKQAVEAIKIAGGLAILAHPHRYPISKSKMASLLTAFSDVKGDGMEVSYSNLDRHIRDTLGEQCAEAGLWASQGSDFHDQDAHWMDLGRIDGLPESCKKNAIWLHPGWH